MRYGSDIAHRLHAEAPPIDLHADPLLWTRFVGYDLLARHVPPLPFAWLGGHVDVPRMRDAGMGAQFFGLVSVPVVHGDLEAVCHRQIDDLIRFTERSSGMLRLSSTAEQVEEVAKDGAIAALLGMEGAQSLRGKIDALEVFAKRGIRYLGLVHLSRNECGVPTMGLGADPRAPLTSFGRDVIARCEELGVIVDLAHLNKAGFLEACAVARYPMLVSHAGLCAVHNVSRNIDDDQLRAIADKGGAVGVIFCPRFLGGDGIDAVVAHIRHIVRVAGEEAAALGSDWDGFVRPTEGLEEVAKLPLLTDALLQAGFQESTIKKILRTNVLRVLREVPPRYVVDTV